jgi:hypothetical protein
MVRSLKRKIISTPFDRLSVGLFSARARKSYELGRCPEQMIRLTAAPRENGHLAARSASLGGASFQHLQMPKIAKPASSINDCGQLAVRYDPGATSFPQED